ncbi:hypothetical protein [Thioflexithrix psekupsensis]|uniref:Uncharacterized protein n=1 Tax=Thioflexithrix psekupsensis TaxID=1570016 RepID=A0A251X9G6_9GAMM|nr:hypothetical protein [Thioflexithrix psekupsensis]OUD14142.1 hypothetical protein TPSD3_07355 [Thioflexithrix psekupsensis]
MVFKYAFGTVLGVLLAFSSVSATESDSDSVEEEEPKKHYQWNDFSLSYPDSGWTLVEQGGDEHNMNIKLHSDRQQPLSLVLTLKTDMPARDEEYDENPTMTSVAFGLPIALKLAQKQEERITVSFAPMNFVDYWDLTARFQIMDSDQRHFHLVEAFHYFPETGENYAILGAVLTRGEVGEVVKEADYYNHIYQVYDIIQSITVTP